MRRRETILDQLSIAAGQNIKERDYWLKQLSGDLEKSSFPYDFKESAPGELRAGDHTLNFTISGDVFLKLIKLSNASDHMLHMILVAGWVLLLDKYTFNGNGDIMVGSPIYRQEDESESRWINTVLPLRHRLTPGMTFKELLLLARETIVQATEHYSYPMELLAEQLGLASPGTDFPLFDSAILVENIHDKNDLGHLHLRMTMSFLKTDENIRGKMGYNTALYRESTVEWIIKHFLYLITAALSDINLEIRQLSILSPEEKTQILYEFNATEKKYPDFPGETIHQWFERQVLQTPGQPALEYAGKELTYHQLNQQANRLAYYLRSKGVKPQGVVGIMMSPCIEMIVGILGILKAGGAYLPIDPTYPQKRILKILNDSGASLLLTKDKEFDKLAFTSFKQFGAKDIKPLYTGPREQIKPFDRLPIPDRSLVNYEKYHQWIGIAMGKYTVSIQATRGCPFNCAYCHKLWPKSHVTRSAENIFREILYCREAGIRRIVFIDDVFNLDKKNAARLLELIINHDLDLQLFFPNGLRGDILTTDFIDLMMAAGTVNIDLALESVSRRIQKLIGKNLDLEKFTRNVQYITKKYPRLLLEMELMLGFPGETEEEARQTLDFVKEQQWVHFPNLNILKIYPNTDMYRLAVENGISEAAIHESVDLAYHELPETLPYAKAFIRQEQTRFMNEYFLSRKRLLHVLPHQMKNFTEEELVQKYNSYLPADIKRFDDILALAGISRQQLGETCFLEEERVAPPGLYPDFKPAYTGIESPDALKVMLLDLSQFFSYQSQGMLYDMVEEPLGLMYLLTYLKDRFRDRVCGKIAKSRIEFDNYNQLKALIIDFKPDLIGIRTLSFYKDFFHRTVSLIRQWGIDVPIISGGPYATSDYGTLLQDPNIDLAVLGEGELTIEVLVEKMLENSKKLPDEETLKQVKGIAFAAGKDKSRLKQMNREIIFMDNLAETLDPLPVENPAHVNQSRDLLYLISTSGSTGEPKSVMLEHRNMLNLMKFEFSEMGIDFSRGILQFTSIGFDVAAQEIFSTLLSGGKLWLMDRDLKGDILLLFDFIRENKISMVFWPPAFLKLVFSEALYVDAFPGTITHIIAAGEQLIVPQSLKEYLAAHRVYLVNNYGPAETHVVTSLTIAPTENIPGRPSIGKPISNTAIYILDKKKNIQPIGVIGELYISGANVGRGYLDRTELTAERFINYKLQNTNYNVQNCTPGGIHASMQSCNHASIQYHTHPSITPLPHNPIYRTGDLARWLPDGNIEFIGRVDHQVQIRGFRVELGEIEKRLKEIEHIKEALVLERGTEIPGGKNYLCAYVVSEKGIDIDKSELRTILSNSLPDFMIPAYFEQISGIPLTTNGKVDRKALPEPKTTGSQEAYSAPQNEIEETLQDIWSALLDIDKHRISVTANFFQLGGHSLKATILTAKIHKAFNLKITLGEMFKKPTIRDLSKYIESRKGEDRHTLIKPVESKEYYPLSSSQRRLYILQQMDETATVYNLPLVVCLEGEVDEKQLEYTFDRLIERHESFRTSVQMVQGEPVQRIHPDARVEVKVEEEDASFGQVLNAFGGQYPKSQELRAKGCISSFIRPFDLSRAPLLRVGLIRLEAGKYILMVDMHHIITDGISLRIFTKEFVTLYSGQQLSPLRLQYKDYSQWQTGEEERKAIGKQQEFWLKQFEGEIPVLALPLDFARPAVQRFEGKTVTFEIGKTGTVALRRIAAAEGATLFMVLITLYTIFLSKISNQEDIVVGTPVSGRRHTDLEPIIGMFVNTLALRNYPAGEKTFRVFLLEVKERILQAYDNQLYPFEDLVEELGPQVNKDIGRNPLFDVMFVLDDGDITDIKIPGLHLVPYPYENRTAKFDLTLQAIPLEEGLRFNIEYSTALFKEETIRRFTGYFKRAVSAVLEDIKKKISAIEIISPQEKKQLLVDFNNTETEYPTGKTIHELFAAQLEKTPDHIALVGKNQKHEGTGGLAPLYITYQELNRRSHQLACILKEKGFKPDTIGAIMGDRSIETIISIFGILEAGGAFLFIDPKYPEERVNYILKDSKVRFLVKKDNFFRDAKKREELFVLDFEHLDFEFVSNLDMRISDFNSSNLAYILYTSGSTGKPKGVMVNHGSVVNLLFALQDGYPFKESDAYLLKTSILFDVSITELFSWFMGGGRVVILGKGGEKDPQMILDSIARHHITHINFVPSMFHAFLEILNHQLTYKLSQLRYIFLAGEALFPGLVSKFAGLNTKTRLENIYGPTECTVYSSKFSLSDWDGAGSIPIGAPLQNMKLHILSKDNHLQPVGIPGELCIAGAGLARGYLNNPELTAERFCLRRPGGALFEGTRGLAPLFLEGLKLKAPGKNHLQSCSHATMQYHSSTPQYPITPLPHSPIYRTGDLARWLPNGNIEFLGRMDHQVKIRGYRIELGEIKSQLLKYDKIKDTVVVPAGQEPGDSYLCAYIVSNSPITVPELMEYLSAKLPGYMIPAYFVMLTEIPLTPSGKVDRQALPLPEIIKVGEDYQAPRDKCQEKLAEIWSGILKVEKEKISIDANFFKIGGHSLKAAMLAAHIHRTFEVKISLAKIFEAPTIRALAKEIIGSGKTAFIDLAKSEKKEYYPLSFNQKRILYLQQMKQHSSAFNIFGSIDLNDVVEKSLVEKVLNRLVERHESFRTGFKTVDGEWVQFILKEVSVPFQAIDISSLEESNKQEERDRVIEELWRPPFDLSQPPIFRALLLKLDARVYEFVISMHHIVSDGWSMEILRDEFLRLYQGYRTGKNIDLEPLKLQYSDFARWQHRQLAQPGPREQAIQYWKPRLEKGIPIVNLPGDSSGDGEEKTGAAWQFMIDNELKEKIKNLAESANTTTFMVMFTAYLLLVLRFSDQENVACAIINSGREHVSLHPIMGFFVNSIIFHMQIDPEKPFTNLLRQVNHDTLALFHNQNYPLELVFEQLKMKYPNIPVSFNLLNMQDISLSQELNPFEPLHIDYYQDVKFDMEMYLAEFKNGIAVRLSYKRDLYKPETVRYFIEEYIKSLDFFTVHTGKSYQAYRQSGKKICLWT